PTPFDHVSTKLSSSISASASASASASSKQSSHKHDGARSELMCVAPFIREDSEVDSFVKDLTKTLNQDRVKSVAELRSTEKEKDIIEHPDRTHPLFSKTHQLTR
ncbi:hypothetical protein ADUPG1_005640, partial [Aduncisulcus paluster]